MWPVTLVRLMTALLWLLLLLPLAGGLLAQRRVSEVFKTYRAVPNRAGVSGADVAVQAARGPRPRAASGSSVTPGSL